MIRVLKSINNSQIAKSGFHYFIGKIANKAQAFIAIPIFTRLLTPEDYGIVSVYLSIYSVMIVVSTLNLTSGIGRYYYEKATDFNQFLGVNVLFICFCAFLSGSLLLLGANQLSHWLQIPVNLFYLMAIALFFELFRTIYDRVLIITRSSKEYTILSSLTSYTGLGLSAGLIIYFTVDLYFYRLIGVVVAMMLSVFYSVYKLRRYVDFTKLSISHIKYNFNFSLPLLPYALSGVLLGTIDRAILNSLTNATETGLYSLAYNVGLLLMAGIVASNQAFIPNFFEWMNSANFSKIRSSQSKIMLVITLMGIGLIYFSPQIVYILADKSFHGAINLIPVIAGGYLLFAVANLGNHYFQYYKRTGVLAVVNITAGVLNVALNFIFIPEYGKVAAAWTTLVSFLFLAITNQMMLKSLFGRNTLSLSIYKPSIIIFSVAILGYFFIDIIDNSIIQLLLLVSIYITLVIFCLKKYGKY
ncbi:lipopolysaccharide biosynthesis protein [Fulvivirga lutea]|uniref:Oligosaccharide flippase family protein n=1 Tax=Fulvivirga lutea TaxID=2810512 RepID=A0A974WF40_9BACT|nr:oligosaccharide flippase family protein [Fulvivirga lutea]QSE96810.1 oligosaccharide flippase family protein [Fulvivirga lutea]